MAQVLRFPRQRFWLTCLGLFLLTDSLDRVVLSALAAIDGTPVFPVILEYLPLGLLNDLPTAILLAIPFLLGLHLVPGFWSTRTGRGLAHLILFGCLCLLVFIQTAQIVFWNDFSNRFNSIAVNYLIFPREVIGVLQESFDPKLFLTIPILAGLAYAVLYRMLDGAIMAPRITDERRKVAPWAIGATAAAIGMLWLPQVSVGNDRAIAELVASGEQRFLAAALTNDQQYDGLYTGMEDARARQLLRETVVQNNTIFKAEQNPPTLVRRVKPESPVRPLNVILVLEESFGSVYVDSIDNTSGSKVSENLDRLATDGLLFDNIHATGNRTVNALEAIFTSFSPLPGISTARRPGSVGMNSLTHVLNEHGYQTAFLYGGRKVFDNMGDYWSGIGFQAVWDQSDITASGFNTVWGVADEYLFTEALKRADVLAAPIGDSAKPFLLSLLTVSNHRPYTYPAGRIDQDPQEKYRYNSATYADWAFGQFVEQAKAKPWFKDTIFIFVGDHGPRVFGAARVPVGSFRVPMMFYAPAHIAPQRSNVLGSSMDLAPTLLGLLGIAYDSPFFGVDLRRVPAGGGRAIMQHNFSIAWSNGRDIVVIGPGQNNVGYRQAPGSFELSPTELINQELLDRVIATTQTAHRLFYGRQYHWGG